MADRSLVTCQGCQEPVSPGQHFCGNCGLRVTSSGKRPCPHCQKLIKATAKFCPKCRKATNIVAVRRCTCCGEEAESDEDEYCSGCAEPLPPLLKGSPVQKTIAPTVTQLSSDEQVQSLADTPVRPGSGGDGEVSEAPGQDTATFPEDVPGSIAVKQVSEVKVGRSPTAQAQSEKPTDKTCVKRVNDSVGKVATRPRHQGEQYQGEHHQGEQYQRMQHQGEQYQGEQSALPVSQTDEEFSHSATSDISLNRKRNGQNDLNMNNDLVQRKLVRLNIDPEKEIRKDLSGSEAGVSPQGKQRMAPGALGIGTPPGGNGHNVPGLSKNAPVQTEKYPIQVQGVADHRLVANRQGEGATDQRPVANRQGEGATDHRPVANRQGEGATGQGEGATDQWQGIVGQMSEAIDQQNGSTSQQHRSHSYKSEVNIHMKSDEELEGKDSGLGQQDKNREIKSEENTVNDGKHVFGQSVHPDVGRDTSGKDVPLFGPKQTEHGSMMSDECADTRREDDNGNVVTSGEHSMKTRSQTKAVDMQHEQYDQTTEKMRQENKTQSQEENMRQSITYADATKKGTKQSVNTSRKKKSDANSSDEKSDARNNSGQRQQKHVNVIFHVVITPLCKWNQDEETVCILFGHPALGDWGKTAQKDKYKMQIEHDLGDGRYLLRGDVSVPKDCFFNGNFIFYKYVITNKDFSSVKFEYLYFNTRTGSIEDRVLGIRTSVLDTTGYISATVNLTQGHLA